MSVRTSLNQNPLVVAVAVIVLLVAVVGWLVYFFHSPGGGGGHGGAFATVDDGKSWFVYDGLKVPPFDYEGKTAYGAMVYEADGKQFVGLMTRYTAEAKQALDAVNAANASGKLNGMLAGKAYMARESGLEVKKPGEAAWQSWRGRPLPPAVSTTGKPAKQIKP